MKKQVTAALITGAIACSTIIQLPATAQNTICIVQKRTLTQLSNGLLYPSESDYPFEYFENNRIISLPNSTQFLRLIGQQGQPIEQVNIDDFFNKLINNLRLGSSDSRAIFRYQALRNFYKNRFSSATVYRVGTVQVQVYIVGISACGMSGLKTISIET